MKPKSLEESNVSRCMLRRGLEGLDIADRCESIEYSTLLACFKLSFDFAYLPTSSRSLSRRTSMTQMQRSQFGVGKGEQSTILHGGGLAALQQLLVNSCLFIPLMVENELIYLSFHSTLVTILKRWTRTVSYAMTSEVTYAKIGLIIWLGRSKR